MVPIHITSKDGTPANTQITLPCGTPIPLVGRVELCLDANGTGWEGALHVVPCVVNVESASVHMKDFLVAAITTVPRAELEVMRAAIDERIAGLDPIPYVDRDAQVLFMQAFDLAKKVLDPNDDTTGNAATLAASIAELRTRVEARTLQVGPNHFAEAESLFQSQLANLTPEGIETERARVQLNLDALDYIKQAMLPERHGLGVQGGLLGGAGSAIARTHRFEDVAPVVVEGADFGSGESRTVGLTMTANGTASED